MKRLFSFLTMCLITAGSLFSQNNMTTKFFDGKDLTILGKAFDTPHLYGRLPAHLEGKIREQLWYLGRNSAGIALRFSSNTTAVTLKWSVLNNFSMNHMPATGIKGLDLYVNEGDGWNYAGTAKPVGKSSEAVVIKNMERRVREYLIYLPLYDGAEKIEVGVDNDSDFNPKPENLMFSREKRVIFYGTSITQGGCASRPGMAYPSIFSRLSGVETINLGFSGNGRLDLEIAKEISRADFDVLFMDCLPNCTAQIVRDSAEVFIKTIREQKPTAKIVLVENPKFPYLVLDKKTFSELDEENREWKALYLKLKKSDKHIYYIPGDKILGDDSETTVDGVHYTDLGFMRAANELYKHYKKIVKN